MTEPALPPEIEPAMRRALAVGLYNRCWALLKLPQRTAEQDDELIHTAHASRHHWGEIADSPARIWRGEWMCSRVYAVLGRGEPALWHARRALDLFDADAAAADEWDRAAIFEALARASSTAGDAAASADWKARAAAAAGTIADPDDRQVIEDDLASLLG